MKLEISRSEWLRGTGDGKLLAKNGKRCCLGIYARALGIEDAAIDGWGCPYNVKHNNWPAWTLKYPYGGGTTVAKLMDCNDSKDISELEREAAIKELFAKEDVEVSFVE